LRSLRRDPHSSEPDCWLDADVLSIDPSIDVAGQTFDDRRDEDYAGDPIVMPSMVRPVRSVSMAIRIASLVSLVFIEAGSSLPSKLVPECDQANLNVLHPSAP
jgi:hypothetical protein